MRYPEFLKKNGCIGFVAPSFGCNIEPYKTAFGHALDKFEKMGYRTELGPNCYEGCGIGISNTPEKCGQELMEYYCNDTSDVLISCGGGELMCEDLPYVDFEKIKEAKPKWYLGYSDNTNMTFLLTTLCDVASIYGPCAAAFGMEPWHPAIQDAFDVLTGEKLTIEGYDLYEKEGLKDEENPLVPYNVTEPCIRKKVPDTDIKMEGRLVGGCLDVLTLLLGTKYDKVQEFTERYKEDGIIWFTKPFWLIGAVCRSMRMVRPYFSAQLKALSSSSMQPMNGARSPKMKYGTGMRTEFSPHDLMVAKSRSLMYSARWVLMRAS